LIVETSHAIADGIAAKLDGTVSCIPVKDVDAEVEAAHEAP
jgi:hypothetical protein